MERAQIVVITGVVAALALFGLKIWSDRSPVDHPSGSRFGADREIGDVARLDGHGGEQPSGDPWMAGGVARRDGAESKPADSQPDVIRPRARRDGGRAARGAGRGSAEVLAGRSARRSGMVGTSGSSRRVPYDVASGVSIAGSSEGRQPEERGRRREDVIEYLGSQERRRDEFADGAEQSGDPEDDVVLEVNSPEDLDQAIDSHEVKLPDDGYGIELREDSVVAVPDAGNANGDAGSISFDIDPQWQGSDKTDNSFVQIRTPHGWDNRMQLVKNGRFLRFILTDNTGRESDISVPIDHWEPGQTHTVTGTWGDGETGLYIDGRRVGGNTYNGEFRIPPGTPMYIGSDLPGGSYSGAAATIQNFKVYGRALGSEEVASF